MEKYTVKQLKENVRHPYAWPGGYEIVFLTNDGDILCHNCVRSNFRCVLESTKKDIRDGWKIVGYMTEVVNAQCTREMAGDDYISYCVHCNKEFGEMG